MDIRFFARVGLLVATCGAAPLLAGTLSVNGTCLALNCPSPDVLGFGQSTSSPFSFTYQFTNSDRYQVIGRFGALNTSSAFGGGGYEITSSVATITYLGNNSGTSTQQDTLVLDFVQLFQNVFSGKNSSGFEYISGSFGGPIANASSVQGQAFSGDGTAMQVLGPFFAPDDFAADAIDQPASFTTPAFRGDARDTFTFGAGSGLGSFITVNNVPSPAVPEPSSWALLSAGSTLLFLGGLRRRLFYKTTRLSPSRRVTL